MTWSLTRSSSYGAMTGDLLACMAGIQTGREGNLGTKSRAREKGGVEHLQGHQYFYHPAD